MDGAPAAPSREGRGVPEGVVLAVALEGVVTAELVSVVDGTLPRFPPDDVHEHLFGDGIDHLGVDSPIPLQEPEYNAFRCCSSSTFSLPPAAEVRLVQLDLSGQSPCLRFTLSNDREPELVVDALHRLVRDREVERGQERGLLTTEGRDDQDLPLQPLQTLLPLAVPALPIPAPGPIRLPMTAIWALPTEEK